MTKQVLTDAKILEFVAKYGLNETAKKYGLNRRSLQRRVRRIEANIGINKKLTNVAKEVVAEMAERKSFIESTQLHYAHIKDAVLVIGSDAHYWPQQTATCAHRAFVKTIRQLKPDFVIMNGDAFDGAEVSRHPRNGWHRGPTVMEELKECQKRLGEVQKAAGKAELLWPYGNHDMRFDARLANCAPEYANVHGTQLRDHFPAWKACISVHFGNFLVVKHRLAGGVHATYNNALKSGRSMVTGHLHNLNATRFTDYNGPRFGIDCGMLADMNDRQFSYTENAPTNWQSGFVVLTIKNGKLLRPEFVDVLDDNHYSFRGKIHAA